MNVEFTKNESREENLIPYIIADDNFFIVVDEDNLIISLLILVGDYNKSRLFTFYWI